MTSRDEAELSLVVSAQHFAADGVSVLELRQSDGTDLPAWQPGAHIDLALPGEMTRQYSLCGDPANPSSWRIAVLLEDEGRGGSRYVHEEITTGSLVTTRGPRNHFSLAPSHRYVFIAGGIGITPLLPMIAQAEALGAEWALHYVGRSRASMAFLSQLTDLYGERVRAYPRNEVERPDLSALLAEVTPNTLVYCCGPAALIDGVTAAASHWPSESVHTERFEAQDLGDAVSNTSFEVHLSLSGKTIQVSPTESILDAARDAGLRVLSSCGEGTCGTCETVIVEGTADHRDSILTAAEQAANDTMMICVSRASCPRLVLEL